MKKCMIMFVCLFIFVFGITYSKVYAQGGAEEINGKIEALEKELNALKEQLKKQEDISKAEKKELQALREEVRGLVPGEEFYWAKKAQELRDKGLAPWFGKQETKPFLRRLGRNTYLGGYMDHELEFDAGSQSNKTFDQHRLIPFIYSDVSDRVKFATEIEIEHGGTNTQGGVGGDRGEIKVEFATIDFLMTDWLNYRGGIILSPLGKLNLVHDSPLQDLTDRPMVSTFILPTTLSESGMGFFGTFYPTEMSKLDYEIYAVNGFQSIQGNTSVINDTSVGDIQGFIRNSRGSKDTENNTNPAIVGRLAFSPFLGLELGASFHTGEIDDSNENRMTIKALDWTYQRGPFELVGEYGHASIERDGVFDNGSEKSDFMAGDMWGYYIEPRYHFMPQFLVDHVPFITDDSTFTAVLRWGQLDVNSPTNVATEGDVRRTRLTPGFNFRYTEDTVFKAEYQINTEHGRRINAGDPRGTDQNNDSLVFSVATYF
ncbi:MAG: hypothetical protein SCARUB_04627 [Candidatus Scalindua rubra]|uniref:Phosphate-selective porin O and P n=1 Tax=Candidatus Scalindua rubra TaxID=1872076 RepID=A0A1E3X3Z2_9BACT|nr:MAG: hypothetical protein SCARUB_04627 [Candidatus Scalindua rubra]